MTYLSCRSDNQLSPLEALFHDDYGTPFLSKNFYPALDIAEAKDQYTVQVDLPGVKKEDITVSFDNGILAIEGKRNVTVEEKDKGYQRIERAYGQFSRSINLGLGVDSTKIKAQYQDGVLTLTVPKSEKAQAKLVAIE